MTQNNSVLILGNGVSRQKEETKAFVQSWDGPIWGCNWVYQELVNKELHRLDRLIGDKKALKKAIPALRKQRQDVQLICKGHATEELHVCTPAYDLGVPRKKVFDSGTTLVHIALLEKYDKIYLAGFDLGGKDIYIDNHHIRNKSSWIRKWRMLRDEFGLDRIEFVGKDHKPFINSDLPNDYYAQLYTKGINHLKYEHKMPPKHYNEVVIVGNGKSRLQKENFLQTWKGEVWLCDEAFREHKKFPAVHRIGSVQPKIIREAIDYANSKNHSCAILSRDFVEGNNAEIYLFSERRGWVTGPLMLAQALKEDYHKIYLVGFDIKGEDLYGKNVLKSSNYTNQLLTIKKEQPKLFNKKVHLMGDSELRQFFSQEETEGAIQ